MGFGVRRLEITTVYLFFFRDPQCHDRVRVLQIVVQSARDVLVFERSAVALQGTRPSDEVLMRGAKNVRRRQMLLSECYLV